jgi:AraC-like DNA-binding protein
MIIHGVRRPIERDRSDPVADADPVVAAALAYANHHLDSVSAATVSGAVGVSEPTFRRQFRSELNMSWRAYLLQARLLRGMALPAQPGPTVLQVATSVGFDSASAFTRAFVGRIG